jgi:hypothetical protein
MEFADQILNRSQATSVVEQNAESESPLTRYGHDRMFQTL